MTTGVDGRLTPVRAIAGSCLVFCVPSVVLSVSLASGLTLGVVSAALLVALSPLKTDAEKTLAVASMIAVTFATLLSILLGAIWPNWEWRSGGTFSLLVVLNTVLLRSLLNRSATRTFLDRSRQALLTGGVFLITLALLFILKSMNYHYTQSSLMKQYV